ncbi:helix-turn-helix domain-containing protein [Agrobacterium fabrum]|uniref:helix-turn-helix domain-containing protein n=1 Tax=Rhizobium/Agrobacterium group TaxID=227290 RepID=UPI00374D168F
MKQASGFRSARLREPVSYLLSRLFDAGLITMQDSGNYKQPFTTGRTEPAMKPHRMRSRGK